MRGLYEHNSKLAIDSEHKLEQCKKSYEDELSRVHMLLSMAWESVESKDKLLGTIKAETIYKMQHRLTSNEFYIVADDYDGMQYVDFCAWVEDVAKEMLED